MLRQRLLSAGSSATPVKVPEEVETSEEEVVAEAEETVTDEVVSEEEVTEEEVVAESEEAPEAPVQHGRRR